MYKNKLHQFAVEDYMRLDENEAKLSHGAYKCFCERELATNYEKAMTSDYGHPEGDLICAIYSNLVK